MTSLNNCIPYFDAQTIRMVSHYTFLIGREFETRVKPNIVNILSI